jgi:hypothetical protein
MKTLLFLAFAAFAASPALAVSERFLDAVAVAESRGNPNAVGSSGDRGLFQFTPIAWEQTSRLRRAQGFQVFPFSAAFDPAISRIYARTYFEYIEADLRRRRVVVNSASLWLAWTLGPSGAAAIGHRLALAPAYKVRGYFRLSAALR